MKLIPALYAGEYPESCIPRRPWWRGVVPVDDQVLVLRRDDGVVLEQQQDDAGTTLPPRVILTSGETVVVPEAHYKRDPLDALAWFDAAEPMEPPSPAVGQVWTSPTQERAVVATYGGKAIMPRAQVQMGNVVGFPLGVESEWPPRGAWLRAGPGSPWSPA